MKRSVWVAGALFAVLAVLVFVLAPSHRAEARDAAIVVDAETGTVLYARNADKRRYPASLTKIMTLYMTFEALEDGRLTLKRRLKVSRRAAGQTPSRLGLRRGQTITVEDAILGVVTKSANDAATVLAEALGGTEAKFARAMTLRARELGMTRTTFRNATGLPNRRQRTTARDMATLALALYRDFPKYYGYFSRRTFVYGKNKIGNHNRLLRLYPGTDGIKTGYIRASGFNLVASVRRGGTRLVGVVFGGRTARARDAEMMRLLDRAFARRDMRIAALRYGPGQAASQGSQSGSQPRPQPVAAKSTTSTTGAPPVLPPAKPTPPPKPVIAGTWRPPAKATGRWGVQVGTFKRLPSAERRVYQVAQLAPTLLMNKGVSIVPFKQSNRTLYRARLTGLDRRDARRACRELRKRNLACVVLSPNRLNVARS